MTTPASSVRSILARLAFAGVATALLARGGLMIAAAPALVELVARPAEKAPAPPPRPERPRAMVSFPQLAPEQQEPVVPVAEGPAVPAGPPKQPFVPLSGAQVVAITWSSEPELSLASIIFNNEHGLYSINECAWEAVVNADGGVKQVALAPCNQVSEGYLLREIRRFRVRVEHVPSGESQFFDLYGDGKTTLVASATAAPPPAAPAGDSKGKGSAISQLMDNVKQTGANSWEAPPGMREEVLARLSEVAMEGRWIPFFENGKISGFKLAQAVPNSAFEKIGLKSGDVIKSVNGYDISSPDKMLDVFTKLRDARDVNVDVLRGDPAQKNAKTSLKYTIN